MVALSRVQEVAIAGKVKIPASLSYRSIEMNQVQDILNFSPLANGMDLEGLGQLLEPLLSQREEIQNFATKL